MLLYTLQTSQPLPSSSMKFITKTTSNTDFGYLDVRAQTRFPLPSEALHKNETIQKD